MTNKIIEILKKHSSEWLTKVDGERNNSMTLLIEEQSFPAVASEIEDEYCEKEFVWWALQNVEHIPYSDDNYIIGSGLDVMTLEQLYEHWQNEIKQK